MSSDDNIPLTSRGRASALRSQRMNLTRAHGASIWLRGPADSSYHVRRIL
jgi:hypothetical protein